MNNEVKKARDAEKAAETSTFTTPTATRAEVDAAKAKVAEAQKAIDALKDSVGKMLFKQNLINSKMELLRLMKKQ